MCNLKTKMEYILSNSIICVLISFGIVFGNSLVIASIIKFERLQTAPNIFMANLAVADILAGVITTQVFSCVWFPTKRVTFCYIFIYAGLITAIASVSFLPLIAVDRTLCIVKPFLYLGNMIVKRAMLLSAGGWVLAIVSRFSWWRHQMETFSALLAICAGNSPVPGEFPTQRPVTRSFDVFFDLRLKKRLSKQS